MGTVGLVLAVVVPMRSLIWRAMVRKACSTLVALFAEVSRKGMPRLSANSCTGLDMAAADSLQIVMSTHLCNGVLDDLLVGHIGLVADQQLVDALCGISVNLLEPLLHVVERVHVRDIVDDADAVGAAVVRGCDGSETLLAGSIPLSWLLVPAPRHCNPEYTHNL